MTTSDDTEAPSTEIELARKVDWLRAQLEQVQATAELAVTTRPVGPLDEWVNVLRDYEQLGTALARTSFVPKGFEGRPEQITAAMMYGREIGLPPLTTLQNTYVVHGRVGMYAEQLRAMILAAGHEYTVDEMTSERCVMSGRRKGSDRWQTFEYTMTRAKQSGLAAQNTQYQSRPVEMLFARTSAIMAHAQFPDVIRGLVAMEEIEGEDRDVPPAAPEPGKATVTVQRAAKKSAASKRTAAVAEIEADTVRKVEDHEIPDQPALPPLPGEEAPPESLSSPVHRRTESEVVSGHGSAGSTPGEGPASAPEDASSTPAEPDTAGDGSPDDVAATGTDEAYEQQSGTLAAKGKPSTLADQKMLQSRFRALGYTDDPDDREARLTVATVLAGREVESFRAGALTRDEVQAILVGLAECRDRDDVLVLMARIAQDAKAEEAQG